MPTGAVLQGHQNAAPEYDLADEENLPSPFLKKNEKYSSQAKVAGAVGPMMNLAAVAPGTSTTWSATSASTSSRGKRRPSSGLLLRAVAAANSMGRRGTPTTVSPVVDDGDSHMESMGIPRPSLASARKASEEARKALLRA